MTAQKWLKASLDVRNATIMPVAAVYLNLSRIISPIVTLSKQLLYSNSTSSSWIVQKAIKSINGSLDPVLLEHLNLSEKRQHKYNV